jgi:thiaminase/transcriptional activator TenA
MELHRTYSSGFGLSADELERVVKAPTCQAYTDFLIATAANGDLLDALAALLPCAWGYRDVGQAIAARGIAAHNPYRDWVGMYAGPEYSEFVDWCIAITDRLGEQLPMWRIDQLARIFRTSTRYEAAFWEMSWSKETW